MVWEKICVADDFPPNKKSFRKPSMKFGLDIIKKYSIKNNQLFYVGDSISDMQTAINLNCNGLGLNTGEFDLVKKIKEFNQTEIQVFENFKKINSILILIK